MRGGVFLIVIALLLGYLAVSGKYKCLSYALLCIVNDSEPCDCKETETASEPSVKLPALPNLQGLIK